MPGGEPGTAAALPAAVAILTPLGPRAGSAALCAWTAAALALAAVLLRRRDA